MPRKQFIADIQVAADKNILGITSIARGDDDGEVVASFAPPTGAPIEISLLAQPGTHVLSLLPCPNRRFDFLDMSPHYFRQGSDS
jgi:hypothetical protein